MMCSIRTPHTGSFIQHLQQRSQTIKKDSQSGCTLAKTKPVKKETLKNVTDKIFIMYFLRLFLFYIINK
jgi:hypothetical protein